MIKAKREVIPVKYPVLDTDYAATVALREDFHVTGPTKQCIVEDYVVCAGLTQDGRVVGFRYLSDVGIHQGKETIDASDVSKMPKDLANAFNVGD